jgi:AraC-like DNA-binding protein
MKLYVKNMVSLRCKLMVQAVLETLGLHYVTVELGEIELSQDITPEQREQLREKLHFLELELIDIPKDMLVEKIKQVVLEKIHSCDELPKVNYSEYLSQKLGYDYTYLANVFSEACGGPIQQFIIHHKIEKVKELMFYNELNISEISYKLNYSSVAHLSNQFKKITGFPPSAYKDTVQNRKESCVMEPCF